MNGLHGNGTNAYLDGDHKVLPKEHSEADCYAGSTRLEPAMTCQHPPYARPHEVVPPSDLNFEWDEDTYVTDDEFEYVDPLEYYAGDAAGTKSDEGKLEWELLPLDMLEEVVKVLMHGKKKYTAWNWAKGIDYTRLLNASLRHIQAIQRGEDKDPETGILHSAHAVCNLLFLTHQMKNRWKSTPAVDAKIYAHYDDRTDVGTIIPQNLVGSV